MPVEGQVPAHLRTPKAEPHPRPLTGLLQRRGALVQAQALPRAVRRALRRPERRAPAQLALARYSGVQQGRLRPPHRHGRSGPPRRPRRGLRAQKGREAAACLGRRKRRRRQGRPVAGGIWRVARHRLSGRHGRYQLRLARHPRGLPAPDRPDRACRARGDRHLPRLRRRGGGEQLRGRAARALRRGAASAARGDGQARLVPVQGRRRNPRRHARSRAGGAAA
mmetsp:Transcript_39432/g.91322  ORF Transcript_39432/g.91322 Transcript_39432/m.91322 type:complete len:223 (-) Transcript_39432:163-831(-)